MVAYVSTDERHPIHRLALFGFGFSRRVSIRRVALLTFVCVNFFFRCNSHGLGLTSTSLIVFLLVMTAAAHYEGGVWDDYVKNENDHQKNQTATTLEAVSFPQSRRHFRHRRGGQRGGAWSWAWTRAPPSRRVGRRREEARETRGHGFLLYLKGRATTCVCPSRGVPERHEAPGCCCTRRTSPACRGGRFKKSKCFTQSG